ncbi:MAG: hypothetical protein LW823_01410 [Rickettsiales bacterium]|jgi:hypothetical protein|nr:hypothetical protein [Rickettsiales bacterium]
MTESTNNEKSCATGGFNYCFWAKFIVGVPVVFIVSYVAASLAEGAVFQVLFGSAAGIVTVWLAMKIDKIPALQKKVVNK